MDGLMRTDEEIIRDINDIIKRQVQPAVEMHGGVVTLEKYEDGVATMFMSGACSGCALYSTTRYFTVITTLYT